VEPLLDRFMVAMQANVTVADCGQIEESSIGPDLHCFIIPREMKLIESR
jgi:hypothetical protein